LSLDFRAIGVFLLNRFQDLRVQERGENHVSSYSTSLAISFDQFTKFAVTFKDSFWGNSVAEVAVSKVGVGEVFVTAGQSDSANFGQAETDANGFFMRIDGGDCHSNGVEPISTLTTSRSSRAVACSPSER
jgi:hypothetical protein